MDERNTIDHIEDYLTGKLNADQRAALEMEISSDADLSMVFDRHAKAHEVINHGFNKELKERLVLIDRESASSQKIARIRPLIRKLAIAATLVVAVGIAAQFWAGQAYTDLAIAQALLVQTELPEFRSEVVVVTTADVELNAADALFVSGNYDGAEKAYESLVAINNGLSPRAEWNLLLCYLVQNDQTQFELLLQKIRNTPDHEYSDSLMRLERKLNHPLYHWIH